MVRYLRTCIGPRARIPGGNGQIPTTSRKYAVWDGLNTCAGVTRPASRSSVLLALRRRVRDTDASNARAVHIVFALALTLRYELGVKPCAILVGHLEREFGATICGHTKAKAQSSTKERKRGVIELPDLDGRAMGAQIKRLQNPVNGRTNGDLNFCPGPLRAERRPCCDGSWGNHCDREDHHRNRGRIARCAGHGRMLPQSDPRAPMFAPCRDSRARLAATDLRSLPACGRMDATPRWHKSAGQAVFAVTADRPCSRPASCRRLLCVHVHIVDGSPHARRNRRSNERRKPSHQT